MKLDIVVPLYNEEDNLADFYNEVKKSLSDIEYRLIFVNDGSSDNSLKVLKDLYKFDKKRVRVVSFSRNFGKESAIYAGLKNSNAEYTAIIDADLQQDPNYLLDMLNKLDKNDDIDSICMIQAQKKNRFFQKLFYKFINKISKTNFVDGASDFRMFRKKVVESILSLSEKNRFSKGIFSWVGFNTLYLPYVVKERKKGKSKWNFFKLLNYAIDGFVGFSTSPLKFSVYLGLLSSISAFIYLIVILIKTLIKGKDVPGYASIICLILFIGGCILLSIGILGEYLAKTYLEVKNRPIYIESERIGFETDIL